MSKRVRRLRDESVNSKPYISTGRAELLTNFYQSDVADTVSTPVARALAFRYLLQHKTICITEGELIVGERGSGAKATPTYPELCCHTVKDLEVLNSRKITPFLVSKEAKEIYRSRIIPFWKGKTMRERVFAAMPQEWKNAFKAGIFTEFMEQRAPGHAILDDKIYHKGLLDFKREIKDRLSILDYFNDPDAYSKEQELKAMEICADALITFAKRHSEKAKQLARVERDRQRKEELKKIADVCSHVPAHTPRNFWEALQMYWFIHLGVIIELNVWDSFNPGRLDQHLYPFYKGDLEAGRLTKEFAKELLECFWIKFNNQPAPPKVDVTEEQSGTYQDFALINVGGLKEDGSDGVNELSYVILDVLEEMRLIQPSGCVQLSSKSPQHFLRKAIRIIKTGFGQPSIFNTDAIIKEFLRVGKSIEDARTGGPSGCVTISAFGKESCTLTGYCNWPKILELTLRSGVDPQNGRQVGPQTGDPRDFTSFDELLMAYKKQLQYFVDLKIKGNNIIERLYSTHMPSPFMSLLFDDCIAKAKDYHDGGARYNTTYIQGVGLGTLVDSLSALKCHLFDKKKLTLEKLLELLGKNFEGDEKIRRMLLNKTPKYGNDDDYADSIAQMLFNTYFDVLDGRPNTKGGKYHVNLLPTTVHIYFGRVTGATPNGRKAGEPLSEGISPTQGADTSGPTAVFKSAAKIDHTKTGGTLLNQKLMPQLLSNETGINKLAHLVRTYFKLGGHHIQLNVVDAETLRNAQKTPEKYKDLIVRVAGYSDYFVDIGKELQDEIISRTEHQSL
ncbi:MAG: glycyl radical protein [Candidatus Bathyarchaeota archaeon]|nr:glycyl radical protein [Candidatus Bathyarchaeota archaeon]